jgi:hypothetical protein
VTDWPALMRAAVDVDGGTAGVPMLLALVDEREHRSPPSAEDAAAGTPGTDPLRGGRAEDAARLASALDAARAALAPSQGDHDLPVAYVLLATVAAHDLTTGSDAADVTADVTADGMPA